MLAVEVLITKSFTKKGLPSKVELAGKFAFSCGVLRKKCTQSLLINKFSMFLHHTCKMTPTH